MFIYVTGKSGSGKSTFSKKLAGKIGYKYIDVDEIGYKIYEYPEITDSARKLFGEAIYNEQGVFDRKKLGGIVFNERHSERVKAFSDLTWKYMSKILDEQLTEDCVVDWILLPHTKYWANNAVKILFKTEDDSLRLKKLAERDCVPEEYLKLRDKASIEYNEKEFDFVFYNSYDENEMERKVESVIEFLNIRRENMKIGFYAGSFDPFTIGHLHIVKVASRLFDKVIVGIGINPKKTRKYDKSKMLEGIKKLLKSENIKNFEAITFDGLTADVAKDFGANFLIRGVRNGIDYDFEENLALINEEISGIDTIYIRAGEFGAISSSMVFELLKRNKDVSKYIPDFIIDIIKDSKNIKE